jgi:Transposase DDE domain group 1
MSEDILLPFDLPSVCRKKLSVGFDGGQLSSDAGVLLLRGAERKLGLGERLASCIREWRKPERIEHPLAEIVKSLAILALTHFWCRHSRSFKRL